MIQNDSLQDIDFYRNCFVLIPDNARLRTLLHVPSTRSKKKRIFCSCSKGTYASCRHARKLEELYEELVTRTTPQLPHEHFQDSDIRKLLSILMKRHPKSASAVKAKCEKDRIILGEKDTPVHIELTHSESTGRLLERAGLALEGVTQRDRASILAKTTDFVFTDNEKMLAYAGHRTVRMTEEESIWFKAAYHIYREIPDDELEIELKIENTLVLILRGKFSDWEMKIHVPRDSTPDLLHTLREIRPHALPFSIGDAPCSLLFRIEHENQNVIIVPVAGITKDEQVAFDEDNLFNSMVYLPQKNCFISFDNPSLGLLAQGWGKQVELKKENLSTFLENNASVFSSVQDNLTLSSNHQCDLFPTQQQIKGGGTFDRLVNMPCFTRIDHIKIEVEALERQWCTLSLRLGCRDVYVTLEQLLLAREEKKRYCITNDGFFDCGNEGIAGALPFQKVIRKDGNRFVFPRSLLMRYPPESSRCKVSINGPDEVLKKLQTMRESAQSSPKPKKLKEFTSSLRPYQENGLAWLLFLYDNGFGGLLCDDMGLGKTHQVLAFISTLKEQRRNRNPVLVVCPVSVMGHWKKLCTTFAPGLSCSIYHGFGRNVENIQETQADLCITSYGVLRADWDKLSGLQFEVAVFDEAQQLKNPEAAVSQAAESLCCNMKLGLSGTPVENSLCDLKRLLDIVLPGYLGTDRSFAARFLDPIENRNDLKARRLLRYSISPFILRRLKETVLSELPPKIEDNRSCSLTQEQEVLYDNAIQSKGRSLVKQVSSEDRKIPYMHVFALLKFLKTICNHPALALEKPHDYENHHSGKWELFTELIEEAVGSGQKVVVFSQYLGMIEIMRCYLEKCGTGHVILTGQSRNRDKLISRFNSDPQCRVFVGSLKAGGVGIDLVSASVVIHYDRWWNASAEDQATDRVYRIGQKRGVQVFRLITEGTLEEKIDRIISRKKELASLAVSEDSPDMVKSFSREEILELLEWNRDDLVEQVKETGIE